MEGRAQARTASRQPFSIYPDRRRAAMRGMRAPVIVEDHPVADSLTGLTTAREGVQIDALVLEAAPQTFNEDIIEKPAAPIHRDGRHPAWAAGLSIQAATAMLVVGFFQFHGKSSSSLSAGCSAMRARVSASHA